MTVFFTADTHFFHEVVCPGRGYERTPDGAEEMTEDLMHVWNATVKPDDEVWHLGDVSFGRVLSTIDLLGRLNGRKHLIIGNHDRAAMMKVAFRECFDSTQYVKQLKYSPASLSWLAESPLLVRGKLRLWLSHYPHLSWPDSHQGSCHLFGHSHGKRINRQHLSRDVGVDAVSIIGLHGPMSLEQVVEELTRETANMSLANEFPLS